jgi:catechol 2,3-dioxygenase-like lactoylglutathione lyase family enzyme
MTDFGVDHVAIRVSSLDAAVAVLTSRFGFDVLESVVASDGITRVTYLHLDGVDFEVFESRDQEPGFDHLGLRVGDITEAVDALCESGAPADRHWCSRAVPTRGVEALLMNRSVTAELSMHLCTR